MKATEAQTQAAVAQYRKTVLTAFQEVEDALIAVQKTGEQRKALEQQVVALQSAYNLADARYQGGRAKLTSMSLTAQRALFDSELGLARTRRAQLTSVVQLYKVLGGGWSPEWPRITGCRRSWEHGWIDRTDSSGDSLKVRVSPFDPSPFTLHVRR